MRFSDRTVEDLRRRRISVPRRRTRRQVFPVGLDVLALVIVVPVVTGADDVATCVAFKTRDVDESVVEATDESVFGEAVGLYTVTV